MNEERAIAVDLGGTHIRVAVVSDTGRLDHRREIPTGAIDGPEQVVARMGNLINEVSEDADVSSEVAVGVASPGPLDARTGVVLFTPNLKGWHNVPLVELLSQSTGRTIA